MTRLELVEYLSAFINKLDNEDSYEARKVKQLLDNYQGMLVSEMTVDAVLADLASGNLACES